MDAGCEVPGLRFAVAPTSSAARAALDFIGAENVVANTWRPSHHLKPNPHCLIPNSASSISALAIALG